MITFSCLCGIKFTLGDEMAGEMFQCEKCARLVVVPTLDDLQNIKPDGTYELHETPLPAPAAAPPAALPRRPPRYDPFTGELIHDHAVVEEELSPEQLAPPRVMPISTSILRGVITPPPPDAWLSVLGQMGSARNLTVLLLMYAIHVLLAFLMFFVVDVGFFLFYFFPPVVGVFCAGYFALIVQETGPGEKDELPTPMRNFEFVPDIWQPFVQVIFSAFICLAPSLAAVQLLGHSPAEKAAGVAAFLAGVLVLPAVLLTAATGGVFANFRPACIGRIIVRGGSFYLYTVAVGLGGGILAGFGGYGLYRAPEPLFVGPGLLDPSYEHVQPAWLSFGELAIGLCLLYYACWMLGLIWRKHHNDFGWVATRFTKDPEPAEATPLVDSPAPAVVELPENASLHVLQQMLQARSLLMLAVMTALYDCLPLSLKFLPGNLVFLVLFIGVIICLGYYALIIQDTGPREIDELPAPMRSFDVGEDIWEPFAQVAFTLFACLVPAAIVRSLFAGSDLGFVMTVVVCLGILFIMPAVLLVSATAAVLDNYRPDRVGRIIARGGWSYIGAAVGWLLGIALLRGGLYGIFQSLTPSTQMQDEPVWIAFCQVPAGLFLQFYSCWLLGLIWRKHHADFGWVGPS